jgi:hypothetical protein
MRIGITAGGLSFHASCERVGAHAAVSGRRSHDAPFYFLHDPGRSKSREFEVGNYRTLQRTKGRANRAISAWQPIYHARHLTNIKQGECEPEDAPSYGAATFR